MANSAEGEILGHPKALFALFFTELWERFGYYGMRALLVLFMVKALQYPDARAYAIYGAYTGLVYTTPFFGGLIADRFLGYRRAIIMGAVLMAIGYFLMVTSDPLFFFAALGILILGNGFFKPNISTIVGKLYSQQDPRRDGAFTIFYMGINIGALLSGVVCGTIGEMFGWQYGFGLAGLGMVAGLFIFLWGKRLLGDRGLPPRPEAFREPLIRGIKINKITALYIAMALCIPIAALLTYQAKWIQISVPIIGGAFLAYIVFEAIRGTADEFWKIIVILILLVFSLSFWAFFEQAGSSMNIFTDRYVDRTIFGWTIPTTNFQSVNPFFIMILALPFSWLWVKLDRVRMNPSSPLKFALALIQLGLGFVMMVIAAKEAAVNGKSSMTWLILAYFFHTTGELCISPVGLSMVTKLSPARLGATLMGAWFLSSAFANVTAGFIAGLTGGETGQEGVLGYEPVFKMIVYSAGIAAVILIILTPLLNRLSGEKANKPAAA